MKTMKRTRYERHDKGNKNGSSYALTKLEISKFKNTNMQLT